MTSEQEILDRVITLISQIADIPKADLQPSKQLRSDLEIDSLTTIELAVTIQDEFGIEVPDEKLRELKTVQDIVDLIRDPQLATA